MLGKTKRTGMFTLSAGYGIRQDQAMNILAHLHLSEGRSTAFTAGNVLADFMRRVGAEPPDDAFREGLRVHRDIDSFTDRHALVREARAEISPARRRLSGVIIDVAFDYCLSQDWARHHPLPLPEFVAPRLDALRSYTERAGSPLLEIVEAARQGDWLLSYGSREGLQKTFRRMARRHGVAECLPGAEDEILAKADRLRELFRSFYPHLQARVAGPT